MYRRFVLLMLAALLAAAPGAAQPLVAAQSAWSATGSLHQGRFGHVAVLLRNGEVLLAGGTGIGTNVLVSELYNPATGLWRTSGLLRGPHTLATMILLDDGSALLVGGGATISAELYRPATGQWTAVSMRVNRAFSTASLLRTGHVLVTGGTDSLFRPLASYELFDPGTLHWTLSGSMHTVRLFHSATMLPDGRILAAGGSGNGMHGALASAETYDPHMGRWTTTGKLVTRRYFHIAQALADGRVLVAGGIGAAPPNAKGPHFLASAELFNPRSNTWSETGAMPYVLAGTGFLGGGGAPASMLLKDGMVLVIGIDTHRRLRALLYDPRTGRWRPGAPLPVSRAAFTATLLLSGKVLIAGGMDGLAPVGLTTANLYSPE